MPSSNHVAASGGADTVAFIPGSDAGTLGYLLTAGVTYYITAMDIAHDVASKTVRAAVWLGDTTRVASTNLISPEYIIGRGAALEGQQAQIVFDPPLKVVGALAVNPQSLLSVQLLVSDSDVVLSAGLRGYWVNTA